MLYYRYIQRGGGCILGLGRGIIYSTANDLSSKDSDKKSDWNIYGGHTSYSNFRSTRIFLQYTAGSKLRQVLARYGRYLFGFTDYNYLNSCNTTRSVPA